MNRVASRLPETFETVRVKMGSKIAFVLEQQDLALESICNSDEFSAKDKLKATQDYLMLWIRLQNEVQKIIDTIIKVNKTGNPGDGKIFVLPVAEAYRVRTGESGEDIL